MSLINQMLKDLEKRRADSVTAPDSPLKGVNRYTVARRRPAYLIYALLSLLVVLAALVGYLGWAYLQGERDDRVAAAPQTPAVREKPAADPPPAGTSTSRDEPATASSDSPEKTAVADAVASGEQPAPPEVKDPAAAAPAGPVASGPAPRVEPEPADTEPADAPSGEAEAVSKRHRPLSAAQRAELDYKEGYQLLARGQRESGERKLRQALAAYPRHQRARELLAGVYMKNGRFVEAAPLLKEGIRLNPENSLFAKMYARVLLKQNRPAQAIAVLERQPPPPAVDREYHALLAAVYQQAGQYLKSAGSYRDVLRLDPDQGKWWLGLGVSLEKLGKHGEARSAYLRARQSGSLGESLDKFVEQRLAALEAAGL